MPAFSYTTTFLPCPYQGKATLFGGSEVSLQPNIDAFFAKNEYAAHLNEMGAAGWELVSTESVLRAAHTSKFDESKGSFPVTAGFFLFWKRMQG